MTLPAPLAALAQYRQFVAVRLVPDSRRPGKTDKIPINPRTLSAASSTDPATWGTYAEAAATGLPVGFVLTATDPLWCLDIDGAAQPNGAWSPLALELVSALPGAAVEVSQSGSGLHIWGCGTPPAHRCKNTALGIELYHTDRFMCLGNPDTATGNAWQDFTAQLAPVAARYFPATGASDGARATEWTDAPRRDWRGSTDDVDLIRRARDSRSAGSIFGGRASFDDLWTANAGALTRAYPTDAVGAEWGQSEADRALAQHLAFWTGCDCERMLRLMKQSALVREKWDRDDYLPRTILSAVTDCREVCRDKSPSAEELAAAATPSAPVATEWTVPVGEKREGAAFIRPEAFPVVFNGCVYVESQNKAFVPGRYSLVKPDAFRVIFGGALYAMDDTGEKFEKCAWTAWTQNNFHRPPRVSGTCYRPDLPHGAVVYRQGESFVNTWLAANVADAPGDVGPFLNHLAKLLPDERDRQILLSYMAAVVQYPGRKFSWAPLVQGVPGNGKTLLSLVVREAVGHRHTSIPRADQISEKFNAWLADCVFVMVEDIAARDGMIEILKPMITGGALAIERKGIDAEVRDVVANFIFNCNGKDGLRKSRGDRRIAPFFTAQQTPEDVAAHGMLGDYFPCLYAWLEGPGYAHVTNFLRSYSIPDEFNPATMCIRAPHTTSTMEALQYGRGTAEQEIAEAIEQGRIGFRGDFVSSHWLDLLLRDIRPGVPRVKRRALMEDLGYVAHPALTEGRVNNTVTPDGVKPRLYVRHGSPAWAIDTPAGVAQAYVAAQVDNPQS